MALELDRYPDIGYEVDLPVSADPDELRLLRKWEVAIGYRIFSAMRWGQLGEGHITARDPERLDHFWVLAHGIPFWAATIDNLSLVGPDGSVVEGATTGGINYAAHNIHWPILDARPDLVSAAHTHTAFGTPWSANVKPFQAISQESCIFVYDQSIYPGEDVEVDTPAGGHAIAAAMGATRLTRPQRSASWASMRRPVRSISLAMARGRRRGRRIRPPPSAMMPRVASGSMNRA